MSKKELKKRDKPVALNSKKAWKSQESHVEVVMGYAVVSSMSRADDGNECRNV